jgi:hypothetical protein
MPLPRRRLVAPAILTLLTLALLLATVWFGIYSVRGQRELEQAQQARTIRLPVDLAQPGQYQGLLRETHLPAHAARLNLLITPAPAQPGNSSFTGLQGHIRLADQTGNAPVDEDITGQSIIAVEEDGAVRYQLLRYFPSAKGDYTLTLTITRPAPALAGHAQELLGQYEICGLESVPNAIAGLLAWVCGLIGAGCGIGGGLLFRRRLRGRVETVAAM